MLSTKTISAISLCFAMATLAIGAAAALPSVGPLKAEKAQFQRTDYWTCYDNCNNQRLRCDAGCPYDDPNTTWDENQICVDRCESGGEACEARCQ